MASGTLSAGEVGLGCCNSAQWAAPRSLSSRTANLGVVDMVVGLESAAERHEMESINLRAARLRPEALV